MPNFIFKRFSENIWQADVIGATLAVGTEDYKQHGIRGVLCVGANAEIRYHQDLPVLKLPIYDDKLIPPEYLGMAATFHGANGKKTLVHCLGGINRSIAFTAFLLTIDGMEFDKAWKFVKKQTQKDCPYEELHISMQQWFQKQKELMEANPALKKMV